jgi:hypothetical protein
MRSALRTISCLAIASAGFLLQPGRASAQANPIAEQLFHEGQQLLEAGRVHEACEKLSASYGLEAGLGTLLNLAVCHERENRTATAWTEFTEAAARAEHDGDAERAQFAHTHADTLAKSMKRAIIRLDGPAADVTVKLDGRALPAAALGVAIPVDPGSHAIDVSAPGKTTYGAQFATGPDPVTEVHVPALAPLETASAQEPPSPAPATLEPEQPPSGSGKRTAGWIVGGVGVASLGVAAVLGVRALSLSSTAVDEKKKSNTTPGDFADANQAQSDHSAALNNQLAGFIVGGVGLACVGTGLVLLLTSNHREGPPPSAARLVVLPELAPGRAGMAATVSW